MPNPAINLTTGISPNSQIPLDAKCYFLTIASMSDLGENDLAPFSYFDTMIVICVENGKQYIWREKKTNELPGVLQNDFVYPNNLIVNDIDYSGKSYNFFLYYPNQISSESNKIISGGQVSWNQNYSYFVAALTYIIQNQNYNSLGGEIILEQSHPLNPRFDAIVVDVSGNIISIEGEASATPAQPVIDESLYCLISYIYIPAASTEANIEKILVYAENLGTPTEFATSSDDNVLINFDNLINPNNGLKSIHYNFSGNSLDGKLLTFKSQNLLTFTDYSILELYLELSAPLTTNNNYISIYLGNSIDNTFTNRTVLTSGNYGYNQEIESSYQRILFELGDLTSQINEFDQIFIVLTNGDHVSIKIDDIYLLKGTPSIIENTERPYWERIENADVHKLSTNIDYSKIENGDKVRDKEFIVDGMSYVLPLGYYNSEYGLSSDNPEAYDNFTVLI